MTVADTGPGIPDDKREAIFEEYTRLDPEAQQGAGIGLAISRRIARLLGGDLTVEMRLLERPETMNTPRNESTAPTKPFGRLGELTHRFPDVGSLYASPSHRFHSEAVLHKGEFAAAPRSSQVAVNPHRLADVYGSMRFAVLGAFLLLPSVAFALDVRVYPAGVIYVQRSNPDHGCIDLTVHNIVIANNAKSDVVLEGAVVEVLKGARVIESRNVTASEIAATTAAISKNGQMATAELDTDFPWAALTAGHLTLARGSRLHGHEAATVKNVFINVQEMPTAVRVRVRARGVSASTTIGVSQKQPTAYHSPLRGVWLLRSIPNVTSHHRWNSQTEFAVDFFKLGENGLPWKTDGRSAPDYFGYGAPVLAAADGIVVATENGAVQNYDVRLRREGESDADYDRRLTAYNAAMQKAHPYKALLGNHVVIRHANNEYSMYHHLQTGSVSVHKGDRVTAGQTIGAVGDTGDTNLVHLHFQVSDGADPLTARSIPFVFDDLFPPGGDYGKVVRTGK